jgi:hypothetical protein
MSDDETARGLAYSWADEFVIDDAMAAIASALRDARAAGRREGLEEAADKVRDASRNYARRYRERVGDDHQQFAAEALSISAGTIRALIPAPIATQETSCSTCNGTRVMRKMAGPVECNDCTDAREETESQEPGCQGAYCWDGSCGKCMAVPEADWAAWKRGSEETSKP